ncbi:U1 snRNP protein [Coemansia sp. RSA 1813]|nr:U1 snRNP protein [Coemansia sp. RSA 1843]KAJ2092940.1 U1 snRNP protein [Coemansia sp. RSA 986]KAJ2216261.1 U1 snRNP protein [Coemansia sp. RSA 487]KAJ2570566.1 U1 snRNP protein [Coemansia sp. RSA 1813]
MPGSVKQQTSDGSADNKSGTQSYKSTWAEFTTPDGRAYYFNRATQVTTWEKPDELKTQLEKNSAWKEYMKDGRPYWYNTLTKDSTWERPAELGKAAAAAAATGAAGEKEAPTGRSTTFATASSEQAIETAAEEKAIIISPPQHPSAPGIRSPIPTVLSAQESVKPTAHELPAPESQQPLKQTSEHMANRGSAVPQFQPPPVPPARMLETSKNAKPQRREYRTLEDAERAFMDMLKMHKVCGDWTWEQALRAVVNDPDYRALKTLAERKDAFHKYISITRKAEDENRRQLAKRRCEGFYAMLDSLPVCETTRFGKIRHLALGLQQKKEVKEAFLAVSTESERIRLFNAYMDEMAHELKTARRQLRGEQIKTVEVSLDELKTTARWEDTKSKLLGEFGSLLMPILCTNKDERVPMDQPFFNRLAKHMNAQDGSKEEPKDPEGGLSLLDFMDAFDSAIKRAEKLENSQKQREKENMFRQERQNRDAFRQLLKKHRDKITPESTWTELYPLIKTDQRYIDMLGQPGSTPQELYWDEVEILSEEIYHERKALESAMRAESFRVHVDTQLDEVKEFVEGFCRESERPSDQNIVFIYNQLVSKAKRKKQEEEERLARQQRRLLDDFRYALYDLDPELNPEESTWENEMPRIRKLPEFKDIDDEDACKEIFELAIQRQKDRKSQKRRRREDEPLRRSRSPDHDDTPSMKRQKGRLGDVANETGYSSGLEEGEMVV